MHFNLIHFGSDHASLKSESDALLHDLAGNSFNTWCAACVTVVGRGLRAWALRRTELLFPDAPSQGEGGWSDIATQVHVAEDADLHAEIDSIFPQTRLDFHDMDAFFAGSSPAQ